MKDYKKGIKAELDEKTADLFQELKKLKAEYAEKKEKKERELDRLFDEVDELKGSDEKKEKAWRKGREEINNKYNDFGYRKAIEEIKELEQKIADVKVKKELEINNFKVEVAGYYQMNYDVNKFLYEEDHIIIDKDSGREYWHKNLFDFGDITGKKGLAAYYIDEVKDQYDELDRKNIKKIEKLFGQGIRM